MRTDDAAAVLLVEDDDETRALLMRSLRRQGFRVPAAEDEGEAMEVAARERVGAVLTDLQMPALDALLARIRTSAALRGVPAFAVDGDAEEGPRGDGLHVLGGSHRLRELLRR